MRVRFKLAWQTYRVGDEIEPPAMLRDWLMNCGYVEPVSRNERARDEPEPELEVAAVDPVVETTATRSSRSRKRARRKEHAVRT